MHNITYNFFLSYQGVCLKRNFLLVDSVHRYPLIVLKQYKRALLDYYIARFTRSGRYKELDKDSIYLIVHHPWFNYFHWMVEAIPRILRYEDRLNELTLVLPKGIYEIPFVQESIAPFKFYNIEINDQGWHYHVPQGIISPVQPYCYRYDLDLIKKTRDLYRKYFLSDIITPFRKVYVSRRNAARRMFINEDEVIALMKKYDFEIVELENATLKEQVTLFSETKCLISMHGAALTNMLFMQENSEVVELYRKKHSPFDHKSKVYKNLATVLKIRFYELDCEPFKNSDDFFSGNLIVNITELEKLIMEL